MQSEESLFYDILELVNEIVHESSHIVVIAF